MNRQQREEYICQRAYELAETGQHIDCITIVTALVAEGFAEAPEVLNSDLIRADLRQVCAKHWRKSEDQETSPAMPIGMRRQGNIRPGKR
jgi:hypothetical protein